MSFVELFLLALALAADAFTVGAAVGVRHCRPRQVFRLAFHFGLFQSLMSFLGALAGSVVLSLMEDYDHWVVLAVLTFIGLRMIYSARRGDAERFARTDLTRGMALVGLSLAVSMDAFGAGIGLPATSVSLSLAVPVIGAVSALATVVAMRVADRIQARVGARFEIIGGVVLIGLGIWTVLDHLHSV